MLRLIMKTKLKTSVMVFTWRCWNCQRVFRIPKITYLKLMAQEISGVQCKKCLKPPSGNAVAA